MKKLFDFLAWVGNLITSNQYGQLALICGGLLKHAIEQKI